MNTPDNCYLDKGHDAHDLLWPGESCKACGFVMQGPVTPEPTREDMDTAWDIIRENHGRLDNAITIATALARARHAGEVAERERMGKATEGWSPDDLDDSGACFDCGTYVRVFKTREQAEKEWVGRRDPAVRRVLVFPAAAPCSLPSK